VTDFFPNLISSKLQNLSLCSIRNDLKLEPGGSLLIKRDSLLLIEWYTVLLRIREKKSRQTKSFGGLTTLDHALIRYNN
jgi:hypothetical protein